MTLIINNHDVEQLLTMEDTLAALEEAYLQLAAREAVCRPRIDIRIPTSDPGEELPVGHDGRRLDRGLFRDPDEVRHHLRDANTTACVTQEKYCTQARACSAA